MIKNKLTLAICTYNNYELLQICLKSVSNQNISRDMYEVIVLDNTTNELVQAVKNTPAYNEILKICEVNDYRYVLKQTDGLSGARNECISLAVHNLIHYIDDDTELPIDFVKQSISCFDKSENLASFGGKIVADWRLIKKPDWYSEQFAGYLSMLDFGPEELTFGTGRATWLAGANICYTKSSLEKYGGFNLSLGRKGNTSGLLGAEENELLWNFKKNNEKVIYNPQCALKHIVQPERMYQDWFIKRVSWQSVCDVMTNKDHTKYDEAFVEQNIALLTQQASTPQQFAARIKLFRMLSYRMLK